jgi:ABC-type transport system involved in multi-copper enzyme maturation permease subunit
MLWYKSWLETRWRFLIGLAVLMCSAAGTVLAYPQLLKLLPALPRIELGGELGRRVAESLELAKDYRSYIWSQWFAKNLMQMWVLFAVLLGTGGLFSQASGGGALFTLSLPVTRTRLMMTRAALGLGQLLALALVPSLLLTLLSPAIGEQYRIADALVHGTCLFIGGSVWFGLAFLLSTVFSDIWRPALLVLGLAVLLAATDQAFPDLARFNWFNVMSAEGYFRGDALPWARLAGSAALTGAMLQAATMNTARQDF